MTVMFEHDIVILTRSNNVIPYWTRSVSRIRRAVAIAKAKMLAEKYNGLTQEQIIAKQKAEFGNGPVDIYF